MPGHADDEKEFNNMNEVVLIGRLTRDPELRYATNSQTAICTFTLAVDRPQGRDRQQANGPTADFIRITVFGRQAENCSRFLSKGREAAVQGRIQTGSYQDKDGRTVYTTDVVANRVEFIGGRGQGQGDNAGYARGGNEGGYRQPAPANNYPQSPQSGGIPEGFEVIDEDDVPF